MSLAEDLHPNFIKQWTKIVVDNIDDTRLDWNDADLTTKKKWRSQDLDLSDSKSCLVGEAHHFSELYSINTTANIKKCSHCNLQSFTVFEVLNTHDIEKFFEWKDFLYQHFVSVHPEELK